LSQAISNLLHNANKFTPSGGTVTTTLTQDAEGKSASISIQDTGEGIEPGLLARVFDAFEQGDSSLDRKHGGLGLGLALTRGLIDLHGGTVKALSKGKGRGSEFIITLPVEISPSLKRVSNRPSPDSRVKRKVLLIEDNADAAESMRMLLTLSGHSVSTAVDGPQGIELAEKVRPEIIFCDIGLPGSMNGYDVAREIRRRESLAGVYLIALTGYGQPEDIRQAEAAGFDLHLVKPAGPDTLEEAIEKFPPPAKARPIEEEIDLNKR
jgi:two-component system CheB/CheR fusion protein